MRVDFHRFAASVGGPLLFAGMNFLMTLVVQQVMPASIFGLYAFVQLAVASGMAISNGLFGGPLVVALGAGTGDAACGSFFCMNLIASVLAASVLGLVLLPTDAPIDVVLLAAFSAFCMWIRWFIRSAELAALRRSNATLIDCAYAGGALVGLLLLVWLKYLTVSAVLGCQIAAAVFSVIMVWRVWAWMAVPSAWSFSPFLKAFSRHGIWAGMVAVTTEVVANFHGYVITYMHGASAFAPIAMATLLFRPLGVVLSAIVQFERPKMARDLADGNIDLVERSVTWARRALSILWGGNGLAVFLLVAIFPARVLREGYGKAAVYSSICLLAVVVLVKAMREPRSAALQAGGDFKQLSRITGISALMTIFFVLAATFLMPSFSPMTIAGVLLGEVAYLYMLERRFKASDWPSDGRVGLRNET